MKELKKALQEAVSLSKTSVKFCFFIDGLDEYHGDEEDLISILSFFSETLGVKLCVSSRPRSLFDKAFAVRRSTLVISEFTLDDMRTFARSRFDESRYFRELRTAEPVDCDDLMNRIAENSQGVWLWVFLVTRNLVRAINRNEGTAMLHSILHQFPQELEDYFKFMIQGVQKPYRHEMAQICLIVVEQIYPLPLYAFSLLGREEEKGEECAITGLTKPADLTRLAAIENTMKDRLENRCKDLLVIEDRQHPVWYNKPVEFLHRTMHEFLRKSNYQELEREATSDFEPLVSLCSIMLLLMKGIPKNKPKTLGKLYDILLYYAREVDQRRLPPSTMLRRNRVFDELGSAGSQSIAFHLMRGWMHTCIEPHPGYPEDERSPNLALAVEAGLIGYAKSKLDGDPDLLKKRRRPLLDHALRPAYPAVEDVGYRPLRDDAVVSMDMARLLLDRGADPNEVVYWKDGSHRVWEMYLIYCNERDKVSPEARDVQYQTMELLVRHGAKSARKGKWPSVLQKVVGEVKAHALEELAKEVARRRGWLWHLRQRLSIAEMEREYKRVLISALRCTMALLIGIGGYMGGAEMMLSY